MDAKFRDDTVKKMDDQKIEAFCLRNESKLVRLEPEEIVRMWLDWYYARYQVEEQEEGFYISDVDNKELVAFVSKKTPKAFIHAYELFESLNEEIDTPFVSIDGRPMELIEEPIVSLAPNNLIAKIIEDMSEENKDE